MKQLAVILSLGVTIVCSGCARRDTAVLALAMNGHSLSSAHDLLVRTGGLREQVDEVFFRVDPDELKRILPEAGFVRDDSIPDRVRRVFRAFRAPTTNEVPAGAIGFRRADLTPKEGKYCHLLCAEDFTWAYVIYVDSGTS